ncbi:MAG: ABC transporter permease [Rhodanobacteraceae bacterium]
MISPREIGASLATGLATTLARPRHTLLIAFGFIIAGITVAVLLTIPAGLRRLAGNTGTPDVAVVLPNGAFTESSGSFNAELAGVVGGLPGVAHDKAGNPLVSPQFVVATRIPRTGGETATVQVRGVTPAFWRIVGDRVRITTGERFRPGHAELIAGVAAARGFASTAIGDTIPIHNSPWRVTGNFAAGGGFWESELWTGMAVLQSTYNADGKLTCLWVKLTSPAAFTKFRKSLQDDPRTRGLHAIRQPDYYAMQSTILQSFIGTAAKAIALVLGLGAILAIVNALGLALDARRRELAILRAVGFRRGALAVALLVEVLVIGAVCAGVAVLVAWLAVNGREIGSSAISSAIEFRMQVDGHVIGWTVVYLLVIGLLSAIWPIVRAVRAPLTRALQDE